MALSGPKSKEFDEPQVQTLWAIALKGDFNADELDSLRVSFNSIRILCFFSKC